MHLCIYNITTPVVGIVFHVQLIYNILLFAAPRGEKRYGLVSFRAAASVKFVKHEQYTCFVDVGKN